MTIACALKTEAGVWIGSDTQLTMRSGFILPVAKKKWETCGRFRWAFSGHVRILGALSAAPAGGMTTNMPGAEAFAEHLREAVKADGWNPDDDKGAPTDYAYDAIIVSPTRVCLAHGDGGFADFGDAFCAIGSGREYAYGAAFALDGMDGDVVVRTAVEAAIACDNACGGEPQVEFIPK